ncbi:hypothetical protein [Streptosporangium sp. NPDC049078]|uniref:hypothetical protein n=1 Tax=Streptosporangium sp. NPDC049078 TaxID=3155767 RepID=UPI00342653B2
MRSYNWWQRRLTREFFGPEQNGYPLLFFVDDEKAVQLHGDAKATDSIDDLCTAVAQEALDWRSNAYGPILQEYFTWKRSIQEDPPPCLPLLAVCVLAATRMRGEGRRGALHYYARLADLLPPPSWSHQTNHGKYLQRDYGTVRSLWTYLHKWLEEREGTRGVSTLRTSKGQNLIGYARSQALVCAADRQRLAPFFEGCTVRDETALLRGLRMWKNRSRLSARLREALDKGDLDDFLGPLLVALATSDDRPLSLPTGLRRLPLRITAADDPRDGWTLRWRAERLGGISGDVLTHPGGHLTVTAEGEGSLYTLSGDLPEIGQSLTSGLVARGEHLEISLPSQKEPIILQEDPLGGWTEVEKAAPRLPSLLLFDARGEEKARDLLKEAGLTWEDREESSVDGWFVAADIEFTEGAGAVVRRPRLMGGLRLQHNGERRHYLVGGEPDLVVPVGIGDVRLDGKRIPCDDERTELRGRGLTAGRHVIDSESGQLTFHLHAPRQQRVPKNLTSPKVDSEHSPLKRATVIDAEGHHTDLAAAEPPAWWHARHTGLSGSPAAIEIPDSAVWLVIDCPDGTIKAQMLRPEEPRIAQVTPEMWKFWTVMCVIEHRPSEKLWTRYLDEVWKLHKRYLAMNGYGHG